MELIKVSRSSINSKYFKVTEKQIREAPDNKNLTEIEFQEVFKLLPTEDENEWMKIFTSKAPELARQQRKMSVCLDAEIETLEENKISYKYNNKLISIEGPKNSFNVSKKLDVSRHDAILEMINQGCITVDGNAQDVLTSMAVDELNLMLLITDKFFFQIYL